MCGACPYVSGLTVVSSRYDIQLCSETLVSDMRHVLELVVPGFGRPVSFCRGKMPRAQGIAEYVRDGYGAFREPKFERGCCEILLLLCLWQKLYVFSLCSNGHQLVVGLTYARGGTIVLQRLMFLTRCGLLLYPR